MSSPAGVIGLVFLGLMVGVCLLSLPWTLGRVEAGGAAARGSPRYDHQDRDARHLPPSWVFRPRLAAGTDADTLPDSTHLRFRAVAEREAMLTLARLEGVTVEELERRGTRPGADQLNAARPYRIMGTDLLGRDLLVRCLAGGGISLGIGLAAAMLSVLVGTLYGSVAGYAGGRVDAIMMRVVDVLYGLPYILLVVLLAVAVDSRVEAWQTGRAERASLARAEFVEGGLAARGVSDGDAPVARAALEVEAMSMIGSGELSPGTRQTIGIVTLLFAIGGVSWLTMARVIRGQVLSLKAQPFVEAARAMGVPVGGLFRRHLLPNLVGPIIVYATLTVPQAILQESFLSFLGIGVKPPLPSWGNLAAEGLIELNTVQSNWWMLAFPCILLGATLLALNFVGEGLRERFDPKLGMRGA